MDKREFIKMANKFTYDAKKMIPIPKSPNTSFLNPEGSGNLNSPSQTSEGSKLFSYILLL